MKISTAACLALISIAILSTHAALAATIWVPLDQPTIQAGIDAAADGDLVLVAPGTYIENIDFLGKAITLRGEDGADSTVIDGGECTTGEGSCSVVTMMNEDWENSILDGFSLRNGRGSNYCSPGSGCPLQGGGGIYCYDSNPIIINCTISENTSDQGSGGGIRCVSASTRIVNCTIRDNTAGGISCIDSPVIIANCTIHENSTDAYGGGVLCSFSHLTLTNSTISRNTTSGNGGGISCNSSSPSTIINCTISGNSAGSQGGGIYCGGDSTPTISNCTISDNSAEQGGGLAWSNGSSVSTITNSIFWANSAPYSAQIYYYVASVYVTYSDIEGGWSGEGNIDQNPLFTAPDDFHLTTTSPCIDAGNPDPTHDDACFPPSLGTQRNDMGAYGGPLACGWLCLDVDQDGYYDHLCGGTDCDDTDDFTYPGAVELCDGKDSDCDGTIPPDELDADGDGWTVCGGDCDDEDPAIHPGASDLCDGVDQGCDGLGDEVDVDLDGFMICAGDCDDGRADVSPEAVELCADGIDNDCDGAIDMLDTDCLRCIDLDGDGYGDPASGVCPFPQRDCDDTDPYVNPGAEEGPPISPYCSDQVDNDCDGLIDAMDPECHPAQPCAVRIVPVSGMPIAFCMVPGLVFLLGIVGRKHGCCERSEAIPRGQLAKRPGRLLRRCAPRNVPRVRPL